MDQFQLLNERELANIIGLSYWTVRDMRLKHGLPYIQLGARFYYDLTKVRSWFDDHTNSCTDGKMESLETQSFMRNLTLKN